MTDVNINATNLKDFISPVERKITEISKELKKNQIY
jgi:hypothetical protein